MKNLMLLLVGVSFAAPLAQAQVAKSVLCSAYIASDAKTGKLDDAPALDLQVTPTATGGNLLKGDFKRGYITYNVEVSIEPNAFNANNKADVKATIQKRNWRKGSDVPVKVQTGYDTEFKVYYGDNDLLVWCSQPVI